MNNHYSDEELIADAAKFTHRSDWAKSSKAEIASGLTSHYNAARRKGSEFFQKCCAHMANLRQPFTVEELKASAAPYLYRSNWKKASPHHYSAAWRHGIIDQLTQHMTPKANPYSGDYIVYAYEFADHCVYVGLTFRAELRHTENLVRGPVKKHVTVCSEFAYKIVQNGLENPIDTANAERTWISKYQAEGWTILNKARGGGLGTILRVKWTKDAVLAEARKFQTKQEWIDKSQASYRIAKRDDWFDEAVAHMPRRDARHLVGRTISEETRAKMAAKKLGTHQSVAHRQARSKAVKSWWSTRTVTVPKSVFSHCNGIVTQ